MKIPQNIIDCFELESDICTIKELNDKQKELIRRNFQQVTVRNVLYSEECLFLLSEESHRNWKYYAGFEYVQPWLLVNHGNFYLASYDCEHNRVQEIIEQLNRLEVKTV